MQQPRPASGGPSASSSRRADLRASRTSIEVDTQTDSNQQGAESEVFQMRARKLRHHKHLQWQELSVGRMLQLTIQSTLITPSSATASHSSQTPGDACEARGPYTPRLDLSEQSCPSQSHISHRPSPLEKSALRKSSKSSGGDRWPGRGCFLTEEERKTPRGWKAWTYSR